MTEPELEVNPKWLVLSEVLEEVRSEASESKKLEKCLVVTQDDRTAQQLREVSRCNRGQYSCWGFVQRLNVTCESL